MSENNPGSVEDYSIIVTDKVPDEEWEDVVEEIAEVQEVIDGFYARDVHHIISN